MFRNHQPPSTRTALAAALGLAAAATTTQPVQAQVEFEKIAITRDAAPGTTVVFDDFFAPVLNNQGEVSFNATVTGPGVNPDNDNGIFTGFSENTLAFVAREQTELSGFGAGVAPSLLGSPRSNSSGQLIFFGSLTGGSVDGTTDRIAFLRNGNSVQSASRAGDAAPIGGGVSFAGSDDASFTYSFLNINDAGDIAFTTTFTGTGIDVTNNRAVLAGPLGSLGVVAQEGNAAPGTGGALFGSFFNSDLVLNASGDVAFLAPLTGTGVVSGGDNDNANALYANTFGSLSLVARTGTAVNGDLFGVSYDQILEHDLSDTGQTLFTATLRGGIAVNETNNSGVFLRGNGATQVLLREGDSVLGLAGVVFGGPAAGNVSDPAIDINSTGTIAVRTTLAGDGINLANNGAIFVSENQTDLQLVLREGEQVPGLADGVVFSEVDFGGGLALNDNGDLLVLTQFAGEGIDESNDFGIFFLGADNGYTPELIVRQGDGLDVDNSELIELRTIESFDVALEQTHAFFNDAGQIAFQVTFTDGSEGVFTAAVPEPSTAAIAAIGLGLFTTRRRRK